MPGNVLPNIQLSGYGIGDTESTPHAMADFYDPQGKKYDMVAVLLVGLWDVYSKEVATTLGNSLPTRVAVVTVLGEGGMPGVPARRDELVAWHAFVTTIPSFLDPAWSSWKPLLVQQALPYIVALDARTMEIVSVDVGAPTSPRDTLEAKAAAIRARPASY